MSKLPETPKLFAGQQTGRWTLVRPTPKGVKQGWLCRCACGTEKVRQTSTILRYPNPKGCAPCRNLRAPAEPYRVGMKVGDWKLIRQIQESPRMHDRSWLIQCKCGVLARRAEAILRNPRTTNCQDCGNRAYREKLRKQAKKSERT